ncbi:MAG: cytochrome c maturation protein CcmE [Alphaproteobacteria bacterium]|nr:cytochrome c maturation protein CcmE [Alphaproteobacteria bacterium]
MNEHAKRRLFALGALAIGGAALFWVSAGQMGEDLVYYWSPTELLEHGASAEGATVRIMGMVEPGSTEWSPSDQRLAFRITDGAQTIAVLGQGAPPQMFRDGIGVVVEGELGSDGVFHSDTVIVKHNNEYKPPAEGEMPEEVYKALMKDDPEAAQRASLAAQEGS